YWPDNARATTSAHFSLSIRGPLGATLFPYTTLFRSKTLLLNKIVVFHFVPNSIFFFISSFIKITIYDSLSFLFIVPFINFILIRGVFYGCTNVFYFTNTLHQTPF